jgi:hypothetical protein
LLFTSTGPIVLHGGTEFMRSKGLAPLKEIVKKTAKSGPLYYHGKRDTYNLRNCNLFVWENIGKTKSDKGSTCDYKGMLSFWKGLMALRNSEKGKVFRLAEKLPKGYYQFFEGKNQGLLGYLVDGKILVLLNVSERSDAFNQVNLPSGNWKQVGNINAVDLEGVRGQGLTGGKPQDLKIGAKDLMIWVKE